jgi:hypothetical protein
LKHEFINTKADINEINYDFGRLIQENGNIQQHLNQQTQKNQDLENRF